MAPRSFPVRRAVAALIVAGCALVTGCLGDGDKGGGSKSHRPPAFDDRDPHADRVVLRPQLNTVPVRESQVFIATVYDTDGKPRKKRKVEWMIEGPGSIVEVDEGGYLPGRGVKADTQMAFSETASDERPLTRGGERFTIRPGQTWCIVRSAVEGETTVIAHCPAINDPDRRRATATVYWTDKNMTYPRPATAKAGGECALSTNIGPPGDRSAGYQVRYRIIDGPAAALVTGRGGEINSVTEAVAPVGEDGSGRVSITQPMPAAGINRVGIEVIKPDPGRPGQVAVISRGETKVTWQDSRLDVRVAAPKFVGLNQEATVDFTAAAIGKVDTGTVTLSARLPDEFLLIKTEPRAAVDGNTLIWTLPAVVPGQPQKVAATVRPARLGSATIAADVRGEDGTTGHGSASVTIAEARLQVKVDGPSSAVIGEALPFQVTVTNTGDGPADRVRIQTRLDDGLQAASRNGDADPIIETIPPRQSKTVPLPLVAHKAGTFGFQLTAEADRGQVSIPQTASVEVKDAQLAVSVHGPGRGYVGQEVVWNVVVRNTGDVPIGNASVKVALPPETAFVRATHNGKLANKQVTWDLARLAAREERTINLTCTANRPNDRAVVTATATGTPINPNDASGRPVSLVAPFAQPKPVEAAIAIVGVPALQISVKDSADPARVGQRLTYTVRVTNAGTLPARKVEVVADVPAAMKAVRGTGPGAAAQISGPRVTFPPIDSLAPGAEVTLVVETEPELPGDGRFSVEVKSASQAQPLRAVESTKVIANDARP